MVNMTAQYAITAKNDAVRKKPPSNIMPPRNNTSPCAMAVLTTGVL
jgi:hypothetical protein